MPAGRPSKFDNIDLKQVESLARRGWTDEEMSNFFGVVRSTWYKWKADKKEFSDALKNWKDEADERVERTLYERAIGYSCPDTKFATFEGRITDTAQYTKFYPPETTACIFWLKNRQPGKWRDKIDHELTGKDGEAIKTDNTMRIEFVVPKESDE